MNKLLLLLLTPFVALAQGYEQPDAARIHLQMKKLNFLGSVLYMAAHPDDENTRLITYFSKGRLATTAYLSLTRGDGGQNLIGPELRDQLGVIRTQELLAARRIDGGEQFFTRAIDFGFSKSADEAFRIWNREAVFSDVLKVIRQYQPDVIITRFPPDERAGHGHHTASAMLAHEAFDKANLSDVFPDLVKEFGVWQPKRVYTNTGRWWNKEINEKTPGVITVDVGQYNSALGKSYAEIAALSSSQHRSQGWGQPGNRGYQPEFLELQKGEKAEQDIFEGVNTTWARVKGAEKIQALVEKAIRDYDLSNPQGSLPALIAIRSEILKLGDSVWKERKLRETEELIQDVVGLFIEVTSDTYHGSAGEKVKTSIELINRSGVNVTLRKITAPAMGWDSVANGALASNIKTILKHQGTLNADLESSEPYWLKHEHEIGLFTVKNRDFIGLPENKSAVNFNFEVEVGGIALTIQRPLIHKWTDRVKGELWRPFEIVPPVFINFGESVLLFTNNDPKNFNVVIRSTVPRPIKGSLKLALPEGWRSEPASFDFEIQKRGDEITRSFKIFPSANESKGTCKVIASIEGKEYSESVKYIEYDHIPTQTLMPPAALQVVKSDVRKNGNLVAYIAGAGDDIPEALRNLGYDVWELKNEEITLQNLRKADAVVFGIRALNTNTRMRYFMADVLAYAKEGGTVLMQYNTNGGLEVETFAPFPMKLGRDRVTDETAEVRILKPDHAAFNFPNKINSSDFAGWVQERGLYFPSEWDPSYEALISMNDPAEKAKDGSLLVAPYGDGYFIYTGLAFFRQLPEGVPGAYKLFANLVSLKKVKTEPVKSKAKGKQKSTGKI